MAEWTWLLAIMVTVLVSGAVALFSRSVQLGARDEADKVRKDTGEKVDAVTADVAAVKLDLARNYVRHEDLVDLKKGNELVLRKVTSIQILMARHLGLTTRDIGIREDDIEG